MSGFTYDALPARVVFGAGAFESSLVCEAARLGQHALILSTPGRQGLARRAAELLGAASAGVFTQAIMHVPLESALAARAEAARVQADCCIAIGGGTTVGLAKAIALELGLPILAVPGTYAGSEMTPIWGITEGGIKRTGRDLRVLPRTTIYDPELTLGLPAAVSATSGMNAIAHCVEGLYSKAVHPLVSLMAEEGIRALARALPQIVREPAHLQARTDALYGAWLSGCVLGTAGMALHHKLCHVLGGTFNLPHAATHAILLPHVTAYNAAAAPEAMRRIAAALGAKDAARGLWELLNELRTPTSLKEIGMPAEGIERAAALATANPYDNPAPLRPDAIAQLLRNAFEGRLPEPPRGDLI